MTREQMSEALDRYGGDLGRWPAALRQDAEGLIATDPEAASDFDRARRLDGLLGELTVPAAVDAATIGRIVSHGRGRHDGVLQPTRRLIGWATAAMVATMAIGFVAGVMIPSEPGSNTIAALLFSGADEDIGGGLL